MYKRVGACQEWGGEHEEKESSFAPDFQYLYKVKFLVRLPKPQRDPVWTLASKSGNANGQQTDCLFSDRINTCLPFRDIDSRVSPVRTVIIYIRNCGCWTSEQPWQMSEKPTVESKGCSD